ncbi:hypothetical protein Sar04_48660 [Salinispora arenicola]|uniref:Uncharacterized protein n=1 Tax=Salinispora arenicola TaxID=168697 RepID=A0ABQ4JYY5_SALAC|nr:hypothetical protein Sar04_48660 [Salinispora arenicola]
MFYAEESGGGGSEDQPDRAHEDTDARARDQRRRRDHCLLYADLCSDASARGRAIPTTREVGRRIGYLAGKVDTTDRLLIARREMIHVLSLLGPLDAVRGG